MTPQKENGYTPIANEIMDALVKYRLPGEQMQCLLFILRKTYGFNKKTDSISLSQFVKATGINRGNVARAIKGLLLKKLIYVKKGSVKKDTISISKYRFNKKYGSWLSSVKKDTGSVNIDKKVVSKKTHTKDIITKDILKADSDESATNDVYKTKTGKSLEGKRLITFNSFWEAFNLKQGKAAAADAWLKIPLLTDQIVSNINKAAKIEAERRVALISGGGSPKWAQGWITERRWEDETYQNDSNGSNLSPEEIKEKYGL